MLLRRLRVAFTVKASEIAEIPTPDERTVDFVRRIAEEKARTVSRACPEAWVLSADTVVVLDGQILGKPIDAGDARRMLRCLSGRAHQVVTGVGLLTPDGTEYDDIAVRSSVEFRTLSEEDIESYVASGEPFDKAGAYAIQGGAAQFVRQVIGSYDNVVGLPLVEVRGLLQRHGLLKQISGVAGQRPGIG